MTDRIDIYEKCIERFISGDYTAHTPLRNSSYTDREKVQVLFSEQTKYGGVLWNYGKHYPLMKTYNLSPTNKVHLVNMAKYSRMTSKLQQKVWNREGVKLYDIYDLSIDIASNIRALREVIIKRIKERPHFKSERKGLFYDVYTQKLQDILASTLRLYIKGVR